MNKIRIKNFKGFEDELILSLDNKKNLLLYGENGAGKTSIYDAIRVAFYKGRIEKVKIPDHGTPEDRIQLQNDFWSSYNNRINNYNFEIQINDTDYSEFNITDYKVFMISMEELLIDSKISLASLLRNFFFPIDNLQGFCNTHYKTLEDKVNDALTIFKENISIEIDQEDEFTIKIIDASKNIERKTDVKQYFNEAKLKLIVLLLLLNSILLTKDISKSNKLILDDFITSLDASNRIFLIQYIFDHFSEFQLIVLTHNVSFFNLIMHLVHDIYKNKNKWQFANLFEINNKHNIYIKSQVDTVKRINDDFELLADNCNEEEIESIGNRVRKKFETLLHEYSKLLMIGGIEDTKKILERLVNNKPYYFNKPNTSSDLVDEIMEVLEEENDNNLSQRIRDKINNYKITNWANFQKTMKELKIYQKMTMHPMSHGVSGMVSFTFKEVKASIDLLATMETYIKDMANSNTVSV